MSSREARPVVWPAISCISLIFSISLISLISSLVGHIPTAGHNVFIGCLVGPHNGKQGSRLPYSTDSYFHPLVFAFVSCQLYSMTNIKVTKIQQGNLVQAGKPARLFGLQYVHCPQFRKPSTRKVHQEKFLTFCFFHVFNSYIKRGIISSLHFAIQDIFSVPEMNVYISG